MKATKAQVVPAPEHPMTAAVFAQHARTVIAQHSEKILAEIPTTLRRLGILLLVLVQTWLKRKQPTRRSGRHPNPKRNGTSPIRRAGS